MLYYSRWVSGRPICVDLTLYGVDLRFRAGSCAAQRTQLQEARLTMGEFSPIHWLIVLAIIVILFGGRRIPEVMRGMGEGIRSFKEGMRGDSPGDACNAESRSSGQYGGGCFG